MTNQVELQHQNALAQQKRRLKNHRRADPESAFLFALLETSNRSLADLVSVLERLLIARQQAMEGLDRLDDTCVEFRTQLQRAREAEHWIRGSHRKTTPVAFRETAQYFRREPAGIARKMYDGLNIELIRILRGVPGAVCPVCEKHT